MRARIFAHAGGGRQKGGGVGGRQTEGSSAERVILPDATILLDYMLAKTTGLVGGLVVRPERMRENIERGHGLHASSRVLLALVETAGLSREDAYAIVQRSALRAADERVSLRGVLATDPAVATSVTVRRMDQGDTIPSRVMGTRNMSMVPTNDATNAPAERSAKAPWAASDMGVSARGSTAIDTAAAITTTPSTRGLGYRSAILPPSQ